MRGVSQKDLNLALGAGENGPNTQLLNDPGNNMAWGAAPGGPGSAALGAAGGALQIVGQGLIDHGPVNVPIPVLIGPSWNGSDSDYNNAISSSGSGSSHELTQLFYGNIRSTHHSSGVVRAHYA